MRAVMIQKFGFTTLMAGALLMAFAPAGWARSQGGGGHSSGGGRGYSGGGHSTVRSAPRSSGGSRGYSSPAYSGGGAAIRVPGAFRAVAATMAVEVDIMGAAMVVKLLWRRPVPWASASLSLLRLRVWIRSWLCLRSRVRLQSGIQLWSSPGRLQPWRLRPVWQLGPQSELRRTSAELCAPAELQQWAAASKLPGASTELLQSKPA